MNKVKKSKKSKNYFYFAIISSILFQNEKRIIKLVHLVRVAPGVRMD